MASCLSGLQSRIPPRTQTYVSVSIVCCHIEVSVTGCSLIQRNSTECAHVCVCVCVSNECDCDTPQVKAINWNRVEAPEENKKQDRTAGKIVPISNIQTI